MLRKFLSSWQPSLAALAITAALIQPALAGQQLAAAEMGADQFVAKFSDRAINVLRDVKAGDRNGDAAMRSLLSEHFDLNFISRFVLSRHWRRASATERTAFRATFEDYVVKTYGKRLSNYSGKKIQVKGSRAVGDNGAYVVSAIERPNATPLGVHWRLHQTDGRWAIVDVVVEGVSMIVTQRSEFAAVLRSNGGTVATLTALLREKTAGSTPNEKVAAKSF
jgi:phospholipid transport system substrate-binding protein